jgi:protein TonB
VLTHFAPPRPALAAGRETLPPAPRRAAIALVVALHVLAAVALMQMGAVREAVRQTAPIFATLIPAPVPAPPPAAAERGPAPSPRPVPRPVVPPPPIAAATSTVPAAVETAPTPSDAPIAPAATPVPPMPPVAAAPAAPTEVPAPIAPRTLSASEVGFIDPPRPAYPPLSRKAGEQGRVLLRVLVDEAGRPAQVLLLQSSGYPRLDEAAAAAVRRARFRSTTDNGIAHAVWVLMPVNFTLAS